MEELAALFLSSSQCGCLTNATKLHYGLTMAKYPEIRHAILEFLQQSRHPAKPTEILSRVKKYFPKANKTTVYRGLEILDREGLVKFISFGDRNKRYEISALPHHHHLVCTSCNKVEDVFLNNELNKIEKSLLRQKKFGTVWHSLEFFGLCQECGK